jgi:hypothetical protein
VVPTVRLRLRPPDDVRAPARGARPGDDLHLPAVRIANDLTSGVDKLGGERSALVDTWLV